jgi:Ser/Thr protein kinase RdoA (MazF antagonist)
MDPLPKAALTNYDLPPETTAELINLSENATYRVDTQDGRCFAMRIHRQGYHSKPAIASEIAWQMDLRATGTAVTPQPVKGRNGELIQQIGNQFVVLSHWESGTEPAISQNLNQPFEQLGAIAARMHQHVQTWQRPPWFTRFTWDFETALGEKNPHWGRWRNGIGVDKSTEQLFTRTVKSIGQSIENYKKSQNNFGLIHADLRLANLLIDKATIKVLDFDDCGLGWFMYDAATAISFHEHEPQVPELMEHWKAGYRSIRPLSRNDEAEIPTFIMLRRLLLVAWIGSHSETDLAKSLGTNFTHDTKRLCETFLAQTR